MQSELEWQSVALIGKPLLHPLMFKMQDSVGKRTGQVAYQLLLVFCFLSQQSQIAPGAPMVLT